MGKFIWHNSKVPKGLYVKQVYGVIFTKDGRILLRVPQNDGHKIYSLAGGTTEAFDKDMEDTLRRELIEEVNTTIKKPIYLGYQTYDDGNGELPFAQVRMVALIDKIGEVKPDPDNGEIYGRLLTTPQKAIDLLNWGECGRMMIEEAVKMAKTHLGINCFSDIEEIINE